MKLFYISLLILLGSNLNSVGSYVYGFSLADDLSGDALSLTILKEVCNTEINGISYSEVTALFLNMLGEGVDRNGTFAPPLLDLIDEYGSGPIIGSKDFITNYSYYDEMGLQHKVQLKLTVYEEAYAGVDGKVTFTPNGLPVDLVSYLSGDLVGTGTWAPYLENGIFNPAVHRAGEYVYTSVNGDCTDTAVVTVSLTYNRPSYSNENYVYTRVPQVAIKEVGAINYPHEVIEGVTYYDGLGRPKQSVSIRGGGSQQDLITLIEYDEFGRQSRNYLPYPRNTKNGEVHSKTVEGEGIYNTSLAYLNYYNTLKYNFTTNPYSEKQYETSPLNRVLKQAAPGMDWALGSGHEVEFAYQTNSAGEVRLFRVDFLNGDTASPSLNLAPEEHYLEGTLYKTITRDENHSGTTKNHTTEEFKDKQGRVILKRTYADTDTNGDGVLETEVPHDTYYVYDDYGNLTYVLPPKLNGSTTTLNELIAHLGGLGYQYRYDHRNRLIEKRIPGKGKEYIVYNKLDQPVLTQDANQRQKGEWLYTKYDAFGRVVSTGIYSSTHDTQETMQAEQENFHSGETRPKLYEERSGNVYTNHSFPIGNIEVLTINYYDDYNFDRTGLVVPSANKYGQQITSSRTKGLATGSRVKVLGTQTWITTVIGYDKKGRSIWSTTKNDYLGTTDITENKLDFVGKIEKRTSTHKRIGQADITVEDIYTFDHMGRQLVHTQTINGGEKELISQNNYDGLGQLVRKVVGGRPSENDSIPTTFTDFVRTAVQDNGNISKVSGGHDWNGSLNTNESFAGDGYVEFSPTRSDKMFMVGLTYVDPSHEYDYVVYVVRDFIKVYEGGNNLAYKMPYHVSVEPGDKLTVEREGSSILYKLNGEVYYVSKVPAMGELKGTARIYSPGTGISYIKLVDREHDNALQHINFAYNVRGWLKQINNPENLGNDLFGFEINYNDPQAGATALFNGNISETHWNTQSVNSTNNPVSNQYLYSYDALNRITGAIDNTGNYNLGFVDYDKNGNITNLKRHGHTTAGATTFGSMDILDYDYSGNQLTKVADTGNKGHGFKDGANTSDDYGYDVNGNMITDANKGITGITYNYLNLPTNIAINGGNIQYIYDATGIKQRKVVGSTTTDYAGNYIYKNGILKFFGHPEGYVEYENGSFNYIFQYKDHLGNIRLSYTDANGNGTIESGSTYSEIVKENNYYPFGLQHKGYNNTINGVENNYMTFQGQELEEELGKNTYAYEWRDYDPAIGRFNKIDRFAEKYKNVSPYQFTLNNPIRYTEIAGDSINLKYIQQYDNKNGTNYMKTIVNSLSNATGLALSVSSETGQLLYDKDEDGNAVISQSINEDGNLTDNGSVTARNDIMGAIDNKKTAYSRINEKSSAPRGGLLINIAPNQIDKFIAGSRNVNRNTLGYGMTFIHELHHTALGLGVGDDKSSFGTTGGVVDRLNIIRAELGADYGQRTSYQARKFSNGGKAYLPMDIGSYRRLNANRKPTIATQKFIEF